MIIVLILLLIVLAPNTHTGGYTNPDSYFPHNIQGGSANFDGYGRPYVSFGIRPPRDGIVPYGRSSNVAAGVGIPTAGGGAIWGPAYDSSLDAAAPSSGVGAVWRGAYDSALSQ